MHPPLNTVLPDTARFWLGKTTETSNVPVLPPPPISHGSESRSSLDPLWRPSLRGIVGSRNFSMQKSPPPLLAPSTGSRTGNLSNAKLNSDIANYLFNTLGLTTVLDGNLNLLSEHAPSTIPSDITMRSQRSSTGEPSDNTTDDAGDIPVSSESTIGASSTYSGPISKKKQKKIERRQAKKDLHDEERQKRDGKQRKCKHCGKLGHTGRANEECDQHQAYLDETKSQPFTIIAELKGIVNLGNSDLNDTLVKRLQKLVQHARDVSWVTTLFVNNFCLERLNKTEPIPRLNQDLLYGFASLIGG
jgi:hypothetical protein